LFAVVPAAGLRHGEPGFGRHALTRARQDGAFRILSIGESTTYGAGYDPTLIPDGPTASFSRFLEERLAAGYGRAVQVVNCGRNGYDSHDWPTLAEEALEFAPDLLVLYVGHNELKLPNLLGVLDPDLARIARSRLLLRLFGVPERRFDPPPSLVADPVLAPPQRRFALQLFADGVSALLDAARARGVPVVVCLPASNVLDHRPRLSVFGAALDEHAGIGAEWDDGPLPDLAAADADPARRSAAVAALAAVERSLVAAPDAAILHFRRGRLSLALGDRAAAEAAFHRSQELDGLPERASPDLVARLAACASAAGVLTVDVAARFRDAADRGIPGRDLFYDYCHPRLYGHWLIADLLLRAIVDGGFIAPAAQFRPEREAGGAAATDRVRFEAWCERLGLHERLAAAAVVAQAKAFANQLGTRPEPPTTAELSILDEYLAAARRMDATVAGDPFVQVLDLLLAAARGDRALSRSRLAAARDADAAALAAIGARLHGLPGWVAVLRGAGLTLHADGRFEEERG
jgi:lysophospholipase L1-like esterase